MRPMLAETLTAQNIGQVRLPVYGSPKFDGFRAFIYNGTVMSRSFKPIPCMDVQSKFGKLPNGWDGELIVGDPWGENCFGKTSSVVTTRDASAESVRFFVFDDWSQPQAPFHARLARVSPDFRVSHELLENVEAIMNYEARRVAAGYEGIILRNPTAAYKFGRSTMTDQGMMKLKQFADYEGVVVGVEEMYHNTNPVKIDGQGYADRGSKKEGMVPAGVAGVLLVDYKGQILRVSQGLTQEMRVEFWNTPQIGKLARFKCPPGGKPVSEGGTGLRPPYVFIGFRSEIDV